MTYEHEYDHQREQQEEPGREEDYLDAEDLIDEDAADEDEEEDEIEAKIEEEHKKFKLLNEACSDSRLRARSAPAIGSPSSAKQRIRSAERFRQSSTRVEVSCLREEYLPPEKTEPQMSRMRKEVSFDELQGDPSDGLKWSNDGAIRRPLATVDENQQTEGSPGESGADSIHSEESPMPSKDLDRLFVSAPAVASASPTDLDDPYSFAMQFFEEDIRETLLQKYTQSSLRRSASNPGQAAGPLSPAKGNQRHHHGGQPRKGPSAIAAEGLLGLQTPKVKRRPSSARDSSALALQHIPEEILLASGSPIQGNSPLDNLTPYTTPARKAGLSRTSPLASSTSAGVLGMRTRRTLRSGPPVRWGAPDKESLPHPLGVGTEHVGNLPTRSFQPSGWNDEFADKVSHKVEEANRFSSSLGLRSVYSLATTRRVGGDDGVAVEVSTCSGQEGSAKVISLQSFLNTHNRLRKLKMAKRRTRTPSSDSALATSMPTSPSIRNQLELRQALHEANTLCDHLNSQVALLQQLKLEV